MGLRLANVIHTMLYYDYDYEYLLMHFRVRLLYYELR